MSVREDLISVAMPTADIAFINRRTDRDATPADAVKAAVGAALDSLVNQGFVTVTPQEMWPDLHLIHPDAVADLPSRYEKNRVS